MKIHKARKNPFFSPAAAVILFIAVCAYSGAWFYQKAEGDYGLARLRSVSFTDSCRLSGIVLRREQPVCSRPGGGPLPAAGQRIKAGTPIADTAASQSAVFRESADGLEYLSPDSLKDISPVRLEALMNSKPEKSIFSAGRLVYGHDWYFAAAADFPISADCAEEYLLRFGGIGKIVPAALIYKSPEEEGRCALVFRLTESGNEFSELRFCDAELIFSEYSGLQIPGKALHRDAEGNNFVYTLIAGQAEPAAIEIIYKNGELCIAAPADASDAVREGSVVIVSEKKSDEGSLRNDYSRKCCPHKGKHQ